MFSLKDKINNPEEGMTLLEVLLSLALLALIATSVMSVFTPPALWIKTARDETTAANYASAIMEELRNDRSKLNIVNNVSPQELNLSQEYKPPQPADIDAGLNIELINGYSNLYEVALTINWTEGTKPRELKVTTVMRKY